MLRRALTHPDISVLLSGIKSIDHLCDNVGSVKKGKLSVDVYAEAKRRLKYAGIIPGPVSAD
ncbi:MAG: hypothetical protein LBV27_08840 [Oscillospiraceae bacterium]|nr:hypothetical protein [Oscillospiraceae bacterium]